MHWFSLHFRQPAMKSNKDALASSRRPLWPRLTEEEKQKCMTVIIILDNAPVHWCGSGVWEHFSGFLLCRWLLIQPLPSQACALPVQNNRYYGCNIFLRQGNLWAITINHDHRKEDSLTPPRAPPRNVILLLPKVLMAASCRCVMPTFELGLTLALQ